MKETVLELIETFGLVVDYDQWDEKGWLRAEHNQYKELKPLILYKTDDINSQKKHLQYFLMHMGERMFKKRLNDLISL